MRTPMPEGRGPFPVIDSFTKERDNNMQFFPLIHILFWIAMSVAPQDTSRIVVTGPDKTWTWTKQGSDWNGAKIRQVLDAFT